MWQTRPGECQEQQSGGHGPPDRSPARPGRGRLSERNGRLFSAADISRRFPRRLDLGLALCGGGGLFSVRSAATRRALCRRRESQQRLRRLLMGGLPSAVQDNLRGQPGVPPRRPRAGGRGPRHLLPAAQGPGRGAAGGPITTRSAERNPPQRGGRRSSAGADRRPTVAERERISQPPSSSPRGPSFLTPHSVRSPAGVAGPAAPPLRGRGIRNRVRAGTDRRKPRSPPFPAHGRSRSDIPCRSEVVDFRPVSEPQ